MTPRVGRGRNVACALPARLRSVKKPALHHLDTSLKSRSDLQALEQLGDSAAESTRRHIEATAGYIIGAACEQLLQYRPKMLWH